MLSAPISYPLLIALAFATRACIAFMARPTQLFLAPRHHHRRAITSFLSSSPAPSPSTANEIFQSEGWKPIQQDLDKCPVFTCANEAGQPLAFTLETQDRRSYTVPMFYCDVDDAQEELLKAQQNTDLDNIGIIPFPLGQAFQMWANDQAVIVPNKNAVLQAGAPPNVNPIGQNVPLFACMDIMRSRNEDGTGDAVLPMFMALEDANAAVAQAVELDGGNVDDFAVVSLSLNRAVELLATVPETPAFQFVAPEKSFRFINEYLAADLQ